MSQAGDSLQSVALVKDAQLVLGISNDIDKLSTSVLPTKEAHSEDEKNDKSDEDQKQNNDDKTTPKKCSWMLYKTAIVDYIQDKNFTLAVFMIIASYICHLFWVLFERWVFGPSECALGYSSLTYEMLVFIPNLLCELVVGLANLIIIYGVHGICMALVEIIYWVLWSALFAARWIIKDGTLGVATIILDLQHRLLLDTISMGVGALTVINWAYIIAITLAYWLLVVLEFGYSILLDGTWWLCWLIVYFTVWLISDILITSTLILNVSHIIFQDILNVGLCVLLVAGFKIFLYGYIASYVASFKVSKSKSST